MRQTCCQTSAAAMDKPEKEDSDVEVFVEVLLRLQNEAEAGSAEALELLWWAGLNAGAFLMETEARGTPEAQQALRKVAAKHAAWPTVATHSDDPETRRRLRSINLGKELPFDLESQVKPDRLTKLAREILEHIDFVGSVLRAHHTGEISKRPRLPMYSRTASRLPPFSCTTLSRWWKAASQVFDRWHPDPATVPWMRELARPGASASKVRTIVKRRLRQKLSGLAPKP